jgi:outer membrane receptor protein involved in Fe transport
VHLSAILRVMPHIKKMLAIPAMLLVLSAAHTSSAQSGPAKVKPVAEAPANIGKVSGKITDDKNEAISYATVTLLRTDSSVVNGDLSKDDGSFSISPTGTGSFILRIQSLGLATQYINVTIAEDTPEKNLGKIKLKQTENTLKGVSIVGEKPVVELKVDKKVFNVEKNITTAGGSATDVLQNVPSVSVDVDGNVSLRGNSGVTILIDGKPATMLGSDVTSALQSLPASSIENVEVITNPSARYDAQGTTGIINIITKKDGRLGINGNITLGAGTRDKYNGNIGLNIRKGKWSAFINSSGRENNTYNNVTTDRTDKAVDATTGQQRTYHTYEHVPRRFGGFFNTLGVTYDPNKNNSFTLTENINRMGFGFNDVSDYYVYASGDHSQMPLYHQYRYSESSGGPLSISSSFDYKHKFKKKDEELSVDATYATTSIRRTQYYQTIDDSAGFRSPYFPVNQYAPGGGGNSSLNMWADYTDPLFTKNGKLGLGFKSQFYFFNSHNTPVVDTNGKPEAVDSSLLVKYDYTQTIHAAYVNWSDQLDKFSYQLGLRAETAEYNGTMEGRSKADLKNSFTNLFPSAFISYQLGNQQSIFLNYSRRTNRPNFFQLLPYRDLSNPSTVSVGNPDLIPEFIDNIEFSYNKLDKKGDNIILSAYYQHTQNLIERILTKDQDDTARLLSMPQNITSGTTYGFEAIGNLKLTKIWDATVSANLFQNDLNVNNIPNLPNNSGFGWFGKLNTSLRLPAGFSLQLNGNYESKKVVAQGTIKDTYWFDLALKKSMLKNKLTITANCSDIFKTHRFINDYDLAYYTQTINRVKETRIGNLTVTWRFGKTDIGKNIAGGDKKDMKPQRPKDDTKKPTQPNTEDRGKNMKDGEGGDDQGGGGGQQGGGGQKGGK